MQLRLFQSGQGTLWTNMGNKNMNFLLPLGGEKAEKLAKEDKDKP